MRGARRTTKVRKTEVSLQAQGDLLPSVSGEATAAALTAPKDFIQNVDIPRGVVANRGRYQEGVRSLRQVRRKGLRKENHGRTY